MGLMKIIFFILLILNVSTLYAQERSKILYGLPPLPEDADLIRTTTTSAPIRLHTFPQFMFNLPPMTPLPAFSGPFGVNPIPELPPIQESRLNGKYDNDGDFVPNSTPKPDKQIVENRIHGVKIEPFHDPPALFHRHSHAAPPLRSYANARGVGVVTVAPRFQLTTPSSNLEAGLHTSDDFDLAEEPSHQNQPKNARQWQTTATKLVNQKTPINPSLATATDESIESIDKFFDDDRNDNRGESRKLHIGNSREAEVVKPIGPNTQTQKPNRKEILTTKLLLEALGIRGKPSSTPSPLQGRRHRLPAEVVKPQNRRVKPQRPSLSNQQQFFDYKPKQRTFQPEAQKFVTKPPQIRPRIYPNRPQPPQRIAPPIAQHQPYHFPAVIPILPPQPWNRDPQDAAFLHEVEEYDWRLEYKQNALQQRPPTATQLRGFNRARGETQQSGTPQNSDYEDFVAIRNREFFTDNPPQRNFALPSGAATTEASEVLIPFNNAQAQLSSSNLNGRTGAARGETPGFGQQPQPQQPPPLGFNQSPNFPPVTQNPLFGGLFNNLFNFNGGQQGQQGGGLLFPGFGR